MLNLCRRFKEDKGEIAALRTKEQGDWKKLTTEEKKVHFTIKLDSPKKLNKTSNYLLYMSYVYCLSWYMCYVYLGNLW